MSLIPSIEVISPTIEVVSVIPTIEVIPTTIEVIPTTIEVIPTTIEVIPVIQTIEVIDTLEAIPYIASNLKLKNPTSNRQVKIGGKVYNSLIKKGIIDNDGNILISVVKIDKKNNHDYEYSETTKRYIKKKNPKNDEEYVTNPESNRRIKIGGKSHKDLVKRGVIHI
jgi:hypothetical protein